MSQGEFLDLGADRPPGPVRRFLWVLLAAAVVVTGSAFIADRAFRDRANDAVAACADQVRAAVDVEARGVRATYEYVRWAAGLVDAQGQMQSLYRQIAKSARGSGQEFLRARDRCTSVALLPHHDDLRRRRDECVRVLDAQRSGLAAVATDGRSLTEWLDVPRTC